MARLGAGAFEAAGEGVAGAPFDAVARAWCPLVVTVAVVRTGAGDVDEHFAGVVFADVAEARGGAAVHGVVVVVFWRRWFWSWWWVEVAEVLGLIVRDGREVEEGSEDHFLFCAVSING